MRAWTRVAAGAVLAVALAACGGMRGSGGHVPATGRYAYTGRYLPPGAVEPRVFTGTLIVTEATPERIAGWWEVPQFDGRLQLGGFSEGAYAADAETTRGNGIFKHRLSRGGSATELRCTGAFLDRSAPAGISHPATCELRFLRP